MVNDRHMWCRSLAQSLRKAMGMAKRARKGTPLTACRAAGKQSEKQSEKQSKKPIEEAIGDNPVKTWDWAGISQNQSDGPNLCPLSQAGPATRRPLLIKALALRR